MNGDPKNPPAPPEGDTETPEQRSRKFAWGEDDIEIAPPPAGDTTARDFENVDFPKPPAGGEAK
jgi:hypothetical protein